MAKYIFKRLYLMILTFIIIVSMEFILVRMLPNQIPEGPGDFAQAAREMREAWGYNKPVLTQYGIFVKNVITKFDFGFCTKVGTYLQPTTEYISSRLPITILLNVYTMIFAVPIGIAFGVYAALRKNKWQDHVTSVLIMLFISVPSYVYAFIFQYTIGFKLGWLPIVLKSGTDWFSWPMFRSMLLPIISLSVGIIAGFMRFTRAELTETLTSDYMLLARTKGLTKSQATRRHAFRNSLVPILPMILAEFMAILYGSIVFEQIFGIPGVGKVLINSVTLRDYSLFITISIFYLVVGLSSNILIDISYGFVDPRIRMGGGKTNEY